MSPTIRQILGETIQSFHRAHIDSPALTARLLVAQALGRPREWLVAHDDESPDQAASLRLAALAARVLAHEPLAYVLGHREFYGIDLQVDSRALIPRPETELLVELALEHIALRPERAAGDATCVDLIDVGTGSGAIAIAVCLNAPQARIVAADVSREALALARENAHRLGCEERIRFIESDLLTDITGQAWVIAANLPYVTIEEIEALPPEIQQHEPRVALDGGADGLRLVRRLLDQLNDRLQAGGLAVFELGASQGRAALEAAQARLQGWPVSLRQDLAGLDRVLAVRKPL